MWLALTLALGLAAPPETTPAEAPRDLQVYLVRHGQAFSNLLPKPKMTEAELDRLTPLGREQAAETGRALAPRTPALILTSPAVRARETADEIRQAAPAAPVRVEARVRPQGDEETAGQVAARVLEAVRAERQKHRGRAIVIVAHSEVIGAFLAQVRGEAAQGTMASVRNGSISLVELEGDRLELVFANQ